MVCASRRVDTVTLNVREHPAGFRHTQTHHITTRDMHDNTHTHARTHARATQRVHICRAAYTLQLDSSLGLQEMLH